jgi:GNAT superfamily N-acetyltransferase
LADIPACEEVSESVGWGRIPDNWRRMITLGGETALGIEAGGQMAATAFGIVYGPALAWVGTVITHRQHQGKGYARELMLGLMARLREQQVRCVMLDATEAGQPLYASLGFRPLYRVTVYGGSADLTLTHPPARPFRPEHLAPIVALDAALMGVERPAALADMAQQGWVRLDDDGQRVLGYCIAQGDESLLHLGPWWDESPQGAGHLLRTALAAAPLTSVRLPIPLPHVESVALVQACGLMPLRGCTRMVWGEAPPGDMLAQYSIASYGTG